MPFSIPVFRCLFAIDDGIIMCWRLVRFSSFFPSFVVGLLSLYLSLQLHLCLVIFLFGITSASVGCHQSPLSTATGPQLLASACAPIVVARSVRDREREREGERGKLFRFPLTFSLKIVRKVNYVAHFSN